MRTRSVEMTRSLFVMSLLASLMIGCSSSTIEFRRFPRTPQLADIRNTVKDKETEVTISRNAGLPKRNYIGLITVLREDSTVIREAITNEEVHLSTSYVQSIYCGSCSRSSYGLSILIGTLLGYVTGAVIAGEDNRTTGTFIGSIAGGVAGTLYGAADHQPSTTWIFYNVRDDAPEQTSRRDQ